MLKNQTIYARADKATLDALARVARQLKRTESDTVRYLITEADAKLKAEIKRASIETPEKVVASLETPEKVVASLTPAGEALASK